MNFSNIPYKKRNKYLLIGSIVFLVFIYNVVLSTTIDLYQTSTVLEKKLMAAENAPFKKAALKRKLDKFNNGLSTYVVDSIKNREYILAVVSEFCHKNSLIFKEFPQSVITHEKDFEIETNVIIAEGNFTDLLKLVYELEQKNRIGRPASVNFQKIFDNKRKKEVLILTLYLQNIRIKENNENKI